MMDFLGIECQPNSVVRMGRYDQAHSRLVKIVLPNSRFARMMLNRAPRLRNYPVQRLFLRPSLPKTERDRLRAERVARLNERRGVVSSSQVNIISQDNAVKSAVVHESPAGFDTRSPSHRTTSMSSLN